MEQKMNRGIRGLVVEAPEGNPICSLHDQGAGGNGEKGVGTRDRAYLVSAWFNLGRVSAVGLG